MDRWLSPKSIQIRVQKTRDHTTSLQYDDVGDIGKINNSLMIEAGVTENNKNWTIEI